MVEAATRRLMQALDALDEALERRNERERGQAALTERFHTLDADRSRLAAELDAEVGKSRRLETVNRDIARRLDAAMENIRLVLESQD